MSKIRTVTFVGSSFKSHFVRNTVQTHKCCTLLNRNLKVFTPSYSPRAVLDTTARVDPHQDDNPVEHHETDVEAENRIQNDEHFEENADGSPHDSNGNDWYSIIDPVGKPDNEASPFTSDTNLKDGDVLDLMALDGAGRQLLTSNSYESVVDIDVERGGVLTADEDNNYFYCGVGMDALLESETLVENLRSSFKIETATHVQFAAIPRVLDHRDIVIQSHTGTGKTLAFLLPILEEMDITKDRTQAIVVAPTRELAMQISRECDRLIIGMGIRNQPLIGGANPARQVDKLRRHTPHIVVGTPGRLAELSENRELRLSFVRTIVVDEVDQCLQENFLEHVEVLFRGVSRAQKVLVSATGDVDTVREFAVRKLHRPVLLRVGGKQRIPKTIEHWHCVVPARIRIDLLRKLMFTKPMPVRAIAFVDDPRRVDIVVEKLYHMRVRAAGLRGNAHKLERAEVLAAFRKGDVSLLVTTEVAARGLDVREVTHVINLDLPTDGDHYLHRAGRCGRVGMDGVVVSVTTSETAFVIGRLAKQLGIEIPRMEPRGGEYRSVERRGPEGRRRDGDGSMGRGKIGAEGEGFRKGRMERGAPKRDLRPSGSEPKGVQKASVKRVISGQEERGSANSKVKGGGVYGNKTMEQSLAELREAVDRNDYDFVENSFWKLPKVEGAEEEEDFAPGMEKVKISNKDEAAVQKGKEKKLKKKKARDNAKTKAKALAAKAKVKEETRAQSKQKRKERREREVQEGEVNKAEVFQMKGERRKLTRDTKLRAAAEGWVGNRVNINRKGEDEGEGDA